MNSIAALLSLLIAALAAPSAKAISFSVSTSSCDDDPFSDLKIAVTCNDSTTCQFGDTAIIAGGVTATETFSDSDVILKACVLGFYCPKDYQRSAGSLCDWLDHADGKDCGDAGNYIVSGEEDIPDPGVSSLMSWAVTIKIGLSEECDEETSSAQMAYSMAGLAMFAVAGAAFAAKKRRDAERNDDDKRVRFVEMQDHAVV